MKLSEKQRLFANLLGQFLTWIYAETNYAVTMGECYRTPEMAEIYAKQGKGIKDSLHCKRLAVDLNLFIDGVYKTDTEGYKTLGDKWKSLHPDCRWGGDFSRPDGNHMELKEA